MKRILQLLPCLYFCLVSAWCQAQEPIIISFPETEVQPNTEFCIDVQATNFNNIEGIQFALKWKTEHLNYQSVNIYADDDQNSTYLPNLNSNTNFAVKDGVLRFLWLESSINTAVTLPEKSTLFQICFKASDSEATTDFQLSEVMAGEAVAYQSTEITPVIIESTTISISDDADLPNEAMLSVGSKEVVQGEKFCVPITAKELDSLSSLQLALEWDRTLIAFLQIKFPEENILALSGSNFNYDGTYLRCSWLTPNAQNIAIPDETVLFEVCLEAIGEAGNQAKIEFSDDLIFEATRLENERSVDVEPELESGIIKITNAPIEGEATILVTDAIVEPNKEFCLPVLAQNMLPITGLQFELVWDKEKLQYNSIKLPEEDALDLGIQFGNYSITDNAFRLAWFDINSQNVELGQTQILFELCFTALGTDGEQTLVNIGDNVTLEATTIMDNRPVVFAVEFSPGVVVFTNDVANIYPGDTDLNREVNHYDLVNIGLGYGQNGPVRENASLDFTPQTAENWAASTPITNINYKHADTNGDGTIDAEDTEAIDLNWTTIPTLVNTAFTEEGVPFFIDTDTLRLIETNQLPIILGTATQVAEKVYSIAFSIYYEAEAMLEEGFSVSLENSWLGTSEELISVQRFFPAEKRIDVAISRIDQQGMTGFGELGALNIVMEDVILFQGEREVKFTIDHVKALGEIQSEIMAISTKPSIAQVQSQSVTTNDFLDQAISVYPNPASTKVTIATKSLNINNIELRDVFGKRVSIIYRSNQVMVETLPTGIYFLTVHTDKGSITKKITVR